MSRDAVKLLAVSAMAVNHAAHLFLPPDGLLHAVLVWIGYIVMPVSCWSLVQGFYATRSRKKYIARLLFFAVLSQPAHVFWFKAAGWTCNELDMLFTLSVCFAALCVRNMPWDGLVRAAVLAPLFVMSLPMCWGGVAVAATLLFDAVRSKRASDPDWRWTKGMPAFLILGAAVFFIEGFGLLPFWEPVPVGYLPMIFGEAVFVVLSGVMLLTMKEPDRAAKRSVVRKYGFYVFYPSHLVLLGLARLALG